MWFIDILFWHWWVAALVLLTIELLVPGFFFLWMAAAAFITGCVLLLIPVINSDMQFFLFSVLSIASIVFWRRVIKLSPTETDHPLLNKRGAQYIGRVFVVYEAIENGRGKVKVGDSIWKVRGDDCPEGSSVTVVGVAGTVLEVENKA